MDPGRRNLVLLAGLGALVVLVALLARSPLRSHEPPEASTERSPVLEGAQAPLESARVPQPSAERVAAATPAAAGAKHAVTAPSTSARLGVAGRVTDENGAPIPGAELRTGDRSGPAGLLLARSDDEGAFRGTIAGGQGSLELVVLAEHFRAERVVVSDPAGHEVQLGTVRLTPGSAVFGRVLDEAGRAIPGAGLVWLPAARFPAPGDDGEGLPLPEIADGPFAELRALGYAGGEDEPFVPDTRSDLDGRFRLRGVPLGEGFVAGWKEGRGRGWTELFEVRDAPGAERVLVLPPSPTFATRIEGVVRAPSGAPSAGIGITAQNGERFGFARSGADGKFLLDCGWTEPVELRAVDEEQRWASAVLAGVAPGTLDVVLVLRAPAWLTVRLVDDAGHVVPWGLVDLGADRHETGREGVVRIQQPEKSFQVQAFAPGFRTQTFGPFDPATLRDELLLTLVPGQAVRGRVTFAGRPVAGARVDLAPSQVPGEVWESANAAPREDPFALTGRVDLDACDGTTDSRGAFLVTVHHDGWQSLRVEATGFPASVFGPFRIDRESGAEGLELALARAGSIEGRVRLPPGSDPRERLVGASNGWGFARTAPVADDGSYRIEDLAPGPYQVRPCRAPVAALQQLYPRGKLTEPVVWDCRVEADGTTRFDLDLTQEGSVVLRGQLVLEGAASSAWTAQLLAVSSLMLDPTQMVAPRAETELDAEGRFELVLGRPGPYVLSVLGERGAFEQRVELVTGDNAWSLRCATGRLRVRGSRPAQRQNTDWLRYVANAGPARYTALRRAGFLGDGREWVLDAPLGPGRLELTPDPRAAGGARWSLVRELTVVEGEELLVLYP